MGIWEKLLKTKQNLRKRVENTFGGERIRTLLMVRRQILEQVESRITMDAGGKKFPYSKVIVWLQPPTEALGKAFKSAFLREGRLRMGILKLLKGANVRYVDPFEVTVELKGDLKLDSESVSARPMFQLDFVRQDPSIEKEVPATILTIVKGSAEQPSYELKKKHILIGRSLEVLDREGHMVRINDVVFLDNGDEINSTVSRAHARIWFDFEKNEFLIMDEISRFGSVVMRENHSIEVPSGNPRGIRLRSGDSVYCGQACLRFEIN
jgi:hypothetical protein